MEPLAQLRQVSKRFGNTVALQDVDLAVYPGEVVALLGPNGAGKTTAIRILLAQRSADSGIVRLLGGDPQLPRYRSELGVTPQETDFPANLTVGEIVQLAQAHFLAPVQVDVLLERFDILDLKKRQTGGLSGGQKRRLAVALAFVGNPRIVFLDEPTTGLDVEARHRLWAGIRDYAAQGGTVLLTTHYLEEAETLASRIVVIAEGQVVASGSVAEIKSRVGLKRVRFHAPQQPQLSGVVRAEVVDSTHTLYTADADALVRQLVHDGVSFQDLEVLPASLEEAFLALTR